MFTGTEHRAKHGIEREQTLFANATYGPFAVHSSNASSTATDANGTRIAIAASTRDDQRLDRDLLQAGVPVHRNDELIGHLVQPTHGFRRRARTMALRPQSNSGEIPDGLIFRLRGIDTLSLEVDGGPRVIHCWLRTKNMKTHPPSNPTLELIFAAVDHGFREPVRF